MKTHPNAATIEADTRAWLEKAVIGLNLCPFAKSVYVKNQVRIVVTPANHIDALLETLDAELQLLNQTPAEEIDTTILVHPEVLQDFEEFNLFLDLADQALLDNAVEGVLQIASFHPRYQFADTDVNDISNFTNRAPYPTLHLIREESIDRAVAAFPEAEAIFGRNIDLLEEMGKEGWNALGVKPKAE